MRSRLNSHKVRIRRELLVMVKGGVAVYRWGRCGQSAGQKRYSELRAVSVNVDPVLDMAVTMMSGAC